MTFQPEGHMIVIRGDPSLTKTRISLISMTKYWYTDDQGFLIECRSMEGSLTMEELYDEEVIPTICKSIPALLAKYEDVFN